MADGNVRFYVVLFTSKNELRKTLRAYCSD